MIPFILFLIGSLCFVAGSVISLIDIWNTPTIKHVKWDWFDESAYLKKAYLDD